jgi:hypothetical protein
VLQIGATERGGALRPQRDAPPAVVLEREHLLAYDVGRPSDAAREQLGVLERGGLDPPVSGATEKVPRRALDPLPHRLLGGEDVERAPWSLKLRAHRADHNGADVRAQRAIAVRNGFVTRSSPSVVIPMWPG